MLCSQFRVTQSDYEALPEKLKNFIRVASSKTKFLLIFVKNGHLVHMLTEAGLLQNTGTNIYIKSKGKNKSKRRPRKGHEDPEGE